MGPSYSRTPLSRPAQSLVVGVLQPEGFPLTRTAFPLQAPPTPGLGTWDLPRCAGSEAGLAESRSSPPGATKGDTQGTAVSSREVGPGSPKPQDPSL